MLIISMILFISVPVFAEGDQQQDTDLRSEVVFADDSRYQDIIQIPLTYYDTDNHIYTWKFPYTDDFFRYPSDEFSMLLAQGSVGLTISAFRYDKTNYTPGFTEYMESAGFHDVESFGYDKPTTPDSLAGYVASKTVDDTTVIAAVTCGSGYGKEWARNFLVGDGERHEGFNKSAQNLEKHIQDYIKKHHITGKKKLWISGHSKAGAIANLTAADMIETGLFDDVYAYMTAVPRTTKEPVAYSGIYNICGKEDFVTNVPLPDWGFGRYGKDLFTPSQETDINYQKLSRNASEVSQIIAEDHFRNNPELNYNFHLILSFMGDFFPSTKDYSEEFQGILMKTWTEAGMDNFADIITSALSQMDQLNNQEEKAALFFTRYLSFMLANQEQVKDGSWNIEDSMSDNLMREHRPMTYINWLFSDNAAEEVLMGPSGTRRIVMIGNLDLQVYHDDLLVGTVGHNGKATNLKECDESKAKDAPVLFMRRSGEETVVQLPDAETYKLRIVIPKDTSLSYYELTYNAYNNKNAADYIYKGRVGEGTYDMTIVPDRHLPRMKNVETGKNAVLLRTVYQYTPLGEMQSESESAKASYLSADQIMNLIVLSALGLLIMFLVCLIIAICHHRAIKRGHEPYSHMYVIIPHLLFILLFTALSQLFARYLFSYGNIMTICAVIALSGLFALSVRALILKRNQYNLIMSGIYLLFVITALLSMLHIPVISFLNVNLVVFDIVIVFFCIVTILSFYLDPEPALEWNRNYRKKLHEDSKQRASRFSIHTTDKKN